MKVVSEQLVEAIVRAVLDELRRRGVEISGPGTVDMRLRDRQGATSVEIDFSEYKTPVLTERHVRGLIPDIAEIVVPAGTFCTAGAKDLLQKRKLTLRTKSPSH